MKYEVIVMPEAQEAMEEAYLWLLTRTVQHAPQWYDGLIEALTVLENFPEKYPVASESVDSGEAIRHFIYGDKRHGYRVQYCIRGQTVRVLQIRHAARDG